MVANLAPGLHVERLWSRKAYLGVGGNGLHFDLTDVVVDGLMTGFFLCVGLEIRRELAVGTLRSARAAVAPVLCAIGGMVVPMIVYTIIARHAGAAGGWAIPSATDVALAVGIAGLVAPGLSPGARAFLLTLAVADDLGGIAIIGVWYSHGIAVLPAAVAICLAAVAAVVVHMGLVRLPVALLLLLPAWMLMRSAHIEPPIIGAVFGLLVPIGSTTRGNSVCLEVDALLRRLGPLVGLAVLPLFAVVSASVPISGEAIGSSVAVGVALGLCLGKPLGIFGALWLFTKSGIAEHPQGSSARELLGVSILGGVGFTVSLFIARVGLSTDALQRSATFGVFVGSLLATAGGAAYFRSIRTLAPDLRYAPGIEEAPRR